MLRANKNVFFEQLFAIYNRNLLKRRFFSFRVSGLNFLLNRKSNLPLIIYCNHSSWWDGLAAFQISFEAGLNSFVMMEEKQLRRLFLFRYLGAFSIVRENPREAYKSIIYATDLLRNSSENTLWIFPQGEILPNDLRPLKLYNGIARIIQKVGICSVSALSMRYEFLGEYKPDIFVKITEPETALVSGNFGVKNLTDELRVRLTKNLDELKCDVINRNFSEYQQIF